MSEINDIYKNLIEVSATSSIEDDGNCIRIFSLNYYREEKNKLMYEICKKDKEYLYNELKRHFKFSNK
jgi:hypothetical protein